jgi:hypothetical protein
MGIVITAEVTSMWLSDRMGGCTLGKGILDVWGLGYVMSWCWIPNCSWITWLNRAALLKESQDAPLIDSLWKGKAKCCFILFLRITTSCHAISFYRICRFFCSLSICIFTAALLGWEKRGYFRKIKLRLKTLPPSCSSEIRSVCQIRLERNLKSFSTNRSFCTCRGQVKERNNDLLAC